MEPRFDAGLFSSDSQCRAPPFGASLAFKFAGFGFPALKLLGNIDGNGARLDCAQPIERAFASSRMRWRCANVLLALACIHTRSPTKAFRKVIEVPSSGILQQPRNSCSRAGGADNFSPASTAR